MDIAKHMRAIQGEIVGWRRALHQIPELGNNLPKTSSFVRERLGEMGIPFVDAVGGGGVVGTITGGRAGKTVALRADMDALPVTEEAPVDFKAVGGKMHACGHDAHTAMLLGCAKVLSENKSELGGTVKLFFQPGEEGPGGAGPMIEEGFLDGVDAIFGQHIGCLFGEEYPSGSVIVADESAMACRDTFKIKIIGRGGHGAMPEEAVDPIMIACQLVSAFYMIKARECSSLKPAVISVCTINAGSAENIIPGQVEITGSTRAVDAETRSLIARRMKEVSEGVCAAFGAICDFEFNLGYGITKNNPAMAEIVRKAAAGLGLAEDLRLQRQPLMVSEDFSLFLEKVPGTLFFLSSIVRQDGVVYGHHNSKFMLDEDVFWKGAAVLAGAAAEFLG